MTKKFIQGNIAAAISAIANGLQKYAGYPITPSTETLEYLAEIMDPKDYINSFSELESINLLYGFGSAGQRCMTATSGCGLSLMREGLSYAVGAKVPMVIYNVMRYGPGLGGITPSNEDINIVWGAGHGQSKIPVFTPSTVQEIADCMMYAFDIADLLRIPVLVMPDATLGQMYEPVEIHSSEFKIKKEWAVGQHKRIDISSRKTTSKTVQSYKSYENEMEEQTDFILSREKDMLSTCKHLMGDNLIGGCAETVKIARSNNGSYIVGIGTTGRVIQEVAKQLRVGSIVPILLNPLDKSKLQDVKELLVVEVGGTGLYDIMKYHFPNAKIRSIVFSFAIPDVEEVMERI
jgi:pyruvate/2-oxoacid:ferredoxin oxidoreductase alpha subunit